LTQTMQVVERDKTFWAQQPRGRFCEQRNALVSGACNSCCAQWLKEGQHGAGGTTHLKKPRNLTLWALSDPDGAAVIVFAEKSEIRKFIPRRTDEMSYTLLTHSSPYCVIACAKCRGCKGHSAGLPSQSHLPDSQRPT
jgi:hypothetical protein